MEYNAIVKGFNEHVEEEVIVEIGGVEITGFMPFGISFQPEEKQEYLVSLGFVVLDDIEMQKIEQLDMGFYRIDNSFAYFIRGYFDFDKRTINAGLIVELEEEMVDGLAYFDGCYVQIRVDRINIDFLNE
ncbi:hypothetical protein [Alkaliphilus crotonatoxidans]